MKTLYNILLERIKAEVPAIKHIDFDAGQLEMIAQELIPPVQFPCVLIDIDYPKCEDQNEDASIQLVNPVVNIKLGFQVQKSTDSQSPTATRNAGLAFLDTIEAVYTALQGYSTNTLSALNRRRQYSDKLFNGSGLKVYNIEFETSMLDESAEV